MILNFEPSSLEPSNLAILVLRLRIKYVSTGIFRTSIFAMFFQATNSRLNDFVLFLKQESGSRAQGSKDETDIPQSVTRCMMKIFMGG